jgi:formylmethanofuran dehydrogenase subunit E
MQKEVREYFPDELKKRVAELGIGEPLSGYIARCVEFHTFAAPGLLLGVFMVDYALELLGASPGEKLYGACETTKCAPDPLQVITHCTTGNHRLQVVPIGRFAITMNRPAEGPYADGVRIYLDRGKVSCFPLLDAWFANDPSFDQFRMYKPLVDEILLAGRAPFSYQRVRVRVSPREKWHSVICPECGEPVPDNLLESGHCKGCGSLAYYEKIS